ncbi:hypothetical protein FORMB_08020 [Formosa sp. Hel1_33_131]|jgi:hypothetical protein|nr:hypothetical protein FORMB_08020 [Formosa sp. Hel1_33_131]
MKVRRKNILYILILIFLFGFLSNYDKLKESFIKILNYLSWN